jgi:5-methylcytosine-specific restriction endonuclease McrA
MTKAEKHAAYMREWRAKNPHNREYQREYHSTWRADPENADKARRRARDWYQNNKTRAEVKDRLRRQAQNRRARILEVDDGVDFDAVETHHFDHVIPLSRGGRHSTENIQLAHPFCNWSKNDKLPEEIHLG